MSTLKQTIKKMSIFLLSGSMAYFLLKLITGNDSYIAAKATFEALIFGLLIVAIAEAAHFYQTKKFI